MFISRKKFAELEQHIMTRDRAIAERDQEISTLKKWFADERARHRKQMDQGNEAFRALKSDNEKLNSFLNAHGGAQVWQTEDVIAKTNADQDAAREKLEKLEAEYNALLDAVRPLRREALDDAAGLHDFDHPARDSIALGVDLKEVRAEITSMVRGSVAVSSPDDFEPPTTKARRTKLVKDNARLAIRAFNAEVENIIDGASAMNFDACADRIYKSAAALEKLTEVSGVKIAPRYIELRLRELHLAVQHLDTKRLERELDRERKAELREQARAERELEAERERLEKEKQHYINVLATVQALGDEAEVAKLKAEIVAIDKGIHDVEEREANIRAGYVYVISNIGSFGERLVKIGMTRRLDPMDRVRELGDASVPFNFDVHALFFSQDAVGVEADLHRRFAPQRANLINARREFFAVTPAQVRDALADISGNLLEFTEEPEAEQYRLTQQLRDSQAA
ncbi:MAG: DUF4041 domain-containing protein [Pseudoclavibacter sp.]